MDNKSYDRAYSKARRDRCREIVTRRKLEIGKCECGHCQYKATIDNLHQFDFDHIHPTDKVDGVAELARWGREQALMQELPKCRLLHVTCHRDHTREQQRHGYGFPAVQLEPDLFNPMRTEDDLRKQWAELWPYDHEPPIVIGYGTLGREDDFVVSRDENLHVDWCRRISTGNRYKWHRLVGYYEDTDPQALSKLIDRKNTRR